MNKKEYYVNIGTREISINHDANNDDFIIEASNEEVMALREVFEEIYNSDMRSFFRSHVTAVPYHLDEANDEYDEGMKTAFRMIYNLGNEESRQQIEEMGVLEDLTE